MMRAVLDTNVVMSAIFFGGVPFDVLNAWHSGKFELARMKTKFPSVETERWMRYIEDHATVVSVASLATQVCEDADDDVFLACADAANAKIVCSGDKHLLACNGWNGIEVLPPRLFCNRLKGS